MYDFASGLNVKNNTMTTDGKKSSKNIVFFLTLQIVDISAGVAQLCVCVCVTPSDLRDFGKKRRNGGYSSVSTKS